MIIVLGKKTDMHFTKNLFNHWKAFNLTFFYINFGFVYLTYFGEHHQITISA
jgi:hypothetical protein